MTPPSMPMWQLLVSAPGQSPAGQQLRVTGVLFSQLPLSSKLFWIFLCWGKMIMLRKTKVLGNGTQLKPPSVMQSNAHLHPSPPRWCFNWRISKAVTWLLSSPPLVDVSHQCWEERKGARLLCKSLLKCPNTVILLLSTEKIPFSTLSKVQPLLSVTTYLLIQLFQKQK